MHIQHQPHVTHIQRLALVDGQVLRAAQDVLDLAAVQIVLGERGNVLVREGLDLELAVRRDALDEEREDGALGLGVELVVAQRDVDAGLECLVKCLLLVSTGESLA